MSDSLSIPAPFWPPRFTEYFVDARVDVPDTKNLKKTTLVAENSLAHQTLHPKKIKHSITGCYHSIKSFDRESFVEYALGILKLPFIVFTWSYRTLFLADLVFQGIRFITLSVFALSFGIVLMGIETILEIIRLIRILVFRHNFHTETVPKYLEALEKAESSPLEFRILIETHKKELTKLIGEEIVKTALLPQDETDIKKISLEMRSSLVLKVFQKLHQSFLTLSDKRKAKLLHIATQNNTSSKKIQSEYQALCRGIQFRKLDTLARRVRGSLTEKIYYKIPSAITILKSHDSEAKKRVLSESKHLFSKMHLVTKKTIVIHILALVAILLSVLGLIATLFTCPIFVPLFLGIMATALKLMRLWAPKAYLDQPGTHTVVWSAPIPDWIKRCFGLKVDKSSKHWSRERFEKLGQVDIAAPLTSHASPPLPQTPLRAIQIHRGPAHYIKA